MKIKTNPHIQSWLIVPAVIFLILNSCIAHNHELTPVEYVDPFIGSGAHGHVFVGASVPFGAVQVGPNNIYKGWDWCSGYHYSDSLIIGFSQFHLSGTGIGDLGDVLIMPYTGEVKLDKGRQEYPHNGYLSKFSHDNETAKPGYYSIEMDNGVKVELAATERVGFHRYYFPDNNEKAHIIIDLKEGINNISTQARLIQVDDYTLLGHRFSAGWAKHRETYFAIRSSVPIKEFQLYEDTLPIDETTGDSKNVKGLISFDSTPEMVALKVGISPVSSENALANMENEIPDWDFDKVVQAARDKWNKELSKIEVETDDDAKKRIFYTAAFHAYIHPSLYNDYNGDYRGTDNRIYQNPGFDNYTVLSTWDTYRAVHPLFILTQPERTADFINTMLAIHEQQGFLPIWHLYGYETRTMVGISSLQIVAEALIKGIEGFDAQRAYQAVLSTSMAEIGEGLEYQRELKPIPYDKGVRRTVAQAMELSVSDGSTALMAQAMGDKKNYEYFKERSKNYQLYYDRETGFFRGKKSDGTWNPIFDPLSSVKEIAIDLAEGNAWQYLWTAPQDVYGLMELLGGEERFVERLDTFFLLESVGEVRIDLTGLIGQYAHGNEPSHHIAYLYAYAGQQWKTAEIVHYVMNEFYKDTPDGIIGNEDAGQMSAWYILSSMGFYPVFPASAQYLLGTPLFDKLTLNLDGDKNFVVKAQQLSNKNIYIQSVQLNGKPHTKSYIMHDDIVAGGELIFVMGDTPSDFGNNMADRP
jgi:predicted alpha-1,2-mannosidase